MNRLKLLRVKEKLYDWSYKIIKLINKVILFFAILAFLLSVYQIGFDHSENENIILAHIYLIITLVLFLFYLLRIAIKLKTQGFKRNIINDIILFLGLSIIVVSKYLLTRKFIYYEYIQNTFSGKEFITLIFASIFLVETIKSFPHINKKGIEPPLIFAVSFLFLILIGTGLLLLPNATVEGISIVDALFTATSSVCVTGLIVVDTATQFTFFGQLIILFLIQIGALGIMTFTSFFGYFFRGSFSFENQLFMQDILNEEKVGYIIRTLLKIVSFTLIVELVGAFFIYITLDSNILPEHSDKIFFSIFHSISAFCNAGFSTLTNGLYEEGIRELYNMQLIIAVLIILGGLGFPIIFNLFRYLKYLFITRFLHITKRQPIKHIPRIISINTKLVIYTTAILLIGGAVFYFFSEQNNTLEGLSTYGKVVTSIFGSVTPRTAGFNTVDMTNLAISTVLIYMFLMWIGASPGSTGGGIKTTTFAVAVLNTFSLGEAKDRVEAFRREIANESIRRAFSVMMLSFLVIGTAIFLLNFFDPEKNIIAIAFECFSAYSTVGLSLGITGSLSFAGKLVIIVTMFLGRIGTLTLFVGLIKDVRSLNYHYPKENIFIN